MTKFIVMKISYHNSLDQFVTFNPLTPELIPSAQRCLTGFFTGDFVS
jgi:hypothetical protein